MDLIQAHLDLAHLDLARPNLARAVRQASAERNPDARIRTARDRLVRREAEALQRIRQPIATAE